MQWKYTGICITLWMAANSALCYATGPVLFRDDFQAYDVEQKSDFSIDGVPSGTWSAEYEPTAPRASEIFNTNNFGGTRLWVSIADGARITSRQVEGLEGYTEYIFTVVLVAETSSGSRTVEASYDVLLGQDPISAASLLGGPKTVIARGDGWQIPGSKSDHVFTEHFTTGPIGPEDRLFIRIGRIKSDYDAFLGVDDVSVAKMQPIDIYVHEGVLAEGGSSSITYDIFVRQNPAAPVYVTAKADPQLLVNGQSETVLVFTLPVEPQTPQTVTVTATEDSIGEGIHQGQIFHTVRSDAADYDGFELPPVLLSIEDNDWPVNFIADVFVGGQEGPDGTSHYRIPAMTVTPDGSIAAFAEGRRNSADPGAVLPIDMVMKRSMDHGKTWLPLTVLRHDTRFDYSDPRPVADYEAGKVHLLYTQWPDLCGQSCVPAGLDEASSVLFLQTSDDNGLTWSGPINLNPQTKNPAWRALNSGPGHGIQLRWQTDPDRNGRVLIPAHINGDYPISIYSDDGGTTWQSGHLNTSFTRLNESDVVELTNGDLLWDARPNSGLYRVRLRSSDGGQTWTQQTPGDIYITTVDCGIERYSAQRDGHDRDRILFSGPLGQPTGSAAGRYNMAVWTSYDEGRSFINPTQIHNDFAAYSDLKRLADGSIGILFEETGSTLIRLYTCRIETFENGPHDPMLTQYDGFGNTVDPRRGGLGWTGSWTGIGEFTRLWNPVFNHSSIPLERFRFTAQPGRLDATANGIQVERRLAKPIDWAVEQNVYVSLLVSRALDTTPHDEMDDSLVIGLHTQEGNAVVSFGITDREQFFISRFNDNITTTDTAMAPDSVYLLIAKIQAKNENCSALCLKIVQAGIDRIPLDESQMQWTLTNTALDPPQAPLDRIAIVGGANAFWSVDELRIGKSYEAVIGRPSCTEPGTYLPGDLNRDCYVNLEDFLLFAGDWLGHS
ncbi:MAG: exo-alpha-sialidase [Sedimentisphaerales bacterium]|nr:exo-alpha-sialidase [Sedimentisphaerales bacterium]